MGRISHTQTPYIPTLVVLSQALHWKRPVHYPWEPSHRTPLCCLDNAKETEISIRGSLSLFGLGRQLHRDIIVRALRPVPDSVKGAPCPLLSIRLGMPSQDSSHAASFDRR